MRWLVTYGSFDSVDGAVLEVRWADGRLSAVERARFEPRRHRAVPGKGLTGACPHPGGLLVCSFKSAARGA